MRVGCIRYLNAQPLVAALPETLPEAELVYDVPSALAQRLASGELDAALIPLVEHLRAPGYVAVPGIAIGCRGPVWSVKLLARRPWQEVRCVALDPASRTSAALTRLWFARRVKTSPRFTTYAAETAPEACPADACLVIGDRALQTCDAAFAHVMDLGDAWTRWTGLPFVFAVWSCRSSQIAERLTGPLQQARFLGLERVAALAERWAAQHDLTAELCRAYLTRALRYDLGRPEWTAVAHFHRMLRGTSPFRVAPQNPRWSPAA